MLKSTIIFILFIYSSYFIDYGAAGDFPKSDNNPRLWWFDRYLCSWIPNNDKGDNVVGKGTKAGSVMKTEIILPQNPAEFALDPYPLLFQSSQSLIRLNRNKNSISDIVIASRTPGTELTQISDEVLYDMMRNAQIIGTYFNTGSNLYAYKIWLNGDPSLGRFHYEFIIYPPERRLRQTISGGGVVSYINTFRREIVKSKVLAAPLSTCDDCPFCNLNDKNSFIIHESKFTRAILSSTLGNILVIPKNHNALFHNLPDFYLHDMIPVIKLCSRLFTVGFNVPCSIFQNNGKSADQDILHVHFHINPTEKARETFVSTFEKDRKKFYGACMARLKKPI